eukprot:gene14598-14664_t
MSDKWDCPVCDFVSDGGAECMVCHTLRPADPDGGGDGNVSAPQQQQQQQESMRKRIMAASISGPPGIGGRTSKL